MAREHGLPSLLLLLSCAATAFSAPAEFPASGNGLWYKSPGTNWESSWLPIGNGYLAAMLPGGTTQETTQLNIESLWSGGPFTQTGYDGQSKPVADRDELAAFVQSSRQAVFASSNGTIAEYDTGMGEDFSNYGSYAGAGYLLSTLNSSNAPANYARWLDLDNAIAKTQWDDSDSGSSFTRTTFCSNPLRACVEHTNATSGLPGLTYAFSLYLEDDGLPAPNVTCLDNATLQLRGYAAAPGMLYEMLGRASVLGGNVSCTSVGSANATLEVSGGTEAWFVWVGDTEYDMDAGDAAHGYSFKGTDPHDALLALLETATSTDASYSTILAQHVADYTGVAAKFALDLGQAPDLNTPTDELYSAYKTDAGDPYVEWLLFNYGRYMLVASSRGALPANLQGKWAQQASNSWSSDYHANINLQMNYWTAEMTNLPEVTQSLWDYMEKTWVPRGSETALALYNSTTGWVTHNEMNIFGSTGMKLSAGGDQWANYPESNAWMMVHVWDHFDYTHDTAWWQAQGWPLLKGVAQFHLNKLIPDAHFNDSTLVVAPCNSPEQTPITFGCAHAQQLIWQLLNSAEKGFEAAGDSDTAFIDDLRAKRAAMDKGIHIGNWSQLQEWKFDMDKQNDTHRHLSHLVGLYPGYALSSYNASLQLSYLPSGMPTNYTRDQVLNAVNVSLTHRGIGTGPDADSGWEKVWRAACWAQLGKPDKFYYELSYAIERNFAGNLFSLYKPGQPPFQIDANLAYPAVLLNALVQAPDTATLDEPLVISLLPALPSSKWPAGSITGARIRGGMTLSFSWKDGVPETGSISVDGSATLPRGVQVIYQGKLVASFSTTQAAVVNLSF